MSLNLFKKWKAGGRSTDTITLEKINKSSSNFRRLNGWQCPWDNMQLISWCSIAVLIFLSLLITLPLPFFPLFPAIVIGLYSWNIFWLILLTTLDPGLKEDKYILPVAFDRTIYQHVIENSFCHVCRKKTYVFKNKLF